jgi:hypothetical protein
VRSRSWLLATLGKLPGSGPAGRTGGGHQESGAEQGKTTQNSVRETRYLLYLIFVRLCGWLVLPGHSSASKNVWGSGTRLSVLT